MWIIVDSATKIRVTSPGRYNRDYQTVRGANAALRNLNKIRANENFVVMPQAQYHKQVPMKTVVNLMTGQPVEIPADTPLCCDPSSETHWSM